jgi:hypothetical protein
MGLIATGIATLLALGSVFIEGWAIKLLVLAFGLMFAISGFVMSWEGLGSLRLRPFCGRNDSSPEIPVSGESQRPEIPVVWFVRLSCLFSAVVALFYLVVCGGTMILLVVAFGE